MKTFFKNLNLIVIFFLVGACTKVTSERSISVQGHCLRSAQPNRASIDFYAEALNQDAQKALQEATKSFQAARAEIQKLGLKNLELETIENSVREERVWENNSNVFKGFKARVGLKVVTQDIEKIGEVIAVVSKSGVNNIGQLITDMSPAKLKSEQEACLEQAIENSRSKAARMAKSAGARVGKVISIVDGQAGNMESRPVPYTMLKSQSSAAMAAADSFSAPIDVRSQDISMSVYVVYALE